MTTFRLYRRWKRWEHTLAPALAIALGLAFLAASTGAVGPSLDARAEMQAQR